MTDIYIDLTEANRPGGSVTNINGSSTGNTQNFSKSPLYWDPANSTGLASDDVTNPARGTSATLPLLTWNTGLARGFWGTYSPQLDSTNGVTVIQLSDQPDATDPVNLACSGYLVLSGALSSSFMGTLGSLVAMASGSQQLLAANFVPAAGSQTSSIVVGQLIHNGTRDSWALVNSKPSGSLWNITQPLQKQPTGVAFGTETSRDQWSVDNTWANADVVTLYNRVRTNVNILENRGVSSGSITLNTLTLDYSPATFKGRVCLDNVQQLYPLRMDDPVEFAFDPDIVGYSHLVNCDLVNDFWNHGSVNNPWVGGGQYRGSGYGAVGGFQFNRGFVCNAGTLFLQTDASFDSVWVMSPATWSINGRASITNYIAGSGLLQLNSNANFGSTAQVVYSDTATKVFLNRGGFGLLIDGNAFADAVDRTLSPAVTYTNRALNAGQLTASVANGGFGDCAQMPNGAAGFYKLQPTTAPTAWVTASVGTVTLPGALLQFGALVSGSKLSQATAASGSVPTDFYIQPQPAFAGATGTDRKPGNFIIELPFPTGGGTTHPQVKITEDAVGTLLAAKYNPSPVAPGAAAGLDVRGLSGNLLLGLYDDLILNGQTRVRLCAGNDGAQGTLSLVAKTVFFDFQSGADINSNGGGNGVILLKKATTNPSTATDGTTGVLYGDSSTTALKWMSPSGSLQTTLAPSLSGSVSTQACVDDTTVLVGRIVTTGGFLTLQVPLATAATNCKVEATVMAKVAIAGSVNAVGDTFSDTLVGTFKNVAGTVSQVGTSVDLTPSQSDTSLSTSALSFTIGPSTNINVKFTATATAGTLGSVDVTLKVRVLKN